MATEAYVDDVFTLAQALKQAEIVDSLLDRLPGPDSEVFFTVYVAGDELRTALAVQQALKLSIDAAAIVTEDLSREQPNITRDYVEAMIRDQIVELTIVSLSAGSFLGRFSVNPRTENGRRRALAIGGVGVIALHFIFPPLTIGMVIFEGVMALNEVLTPDAIPATHVLLRTIDPSDLPSSEARIALESGGATSEPEPRPVHVYDVDLGGAPIANQMFLDMVLRVESVEQQSRFVVGAPSGSRVRIWASEPVSPDDLNRFAAEAGTSILSILSH